MRGVRPFLIISILVLMASASLDVTSTPTVTIYFPHDGDVFTTRTVTFNGSSAGSDAEWFQGSRTAFDAGTKDSVVVTSSGTVRLAEGVADNFDDNSINTTLWTRQTGNGLTFTEDGGALNITGTASGSTSNYGAYVIAGSNLEVDFFVSARLLSFSGSGAGYRTHLLLIQDLSNYVQIGQRYDEDEYGGCVLEWGYVTGGTDHTTSLGAASSGEHTYNITYSGGKAKVYQDGVEKASATIALSDMMVWVVGLAKEANDKIAARWDNVSCGRMSPGTLVSSVYDTRTTPPVLRYVNWNDTTTSSTIVSLEVRSSATSDMASPSNWLSVSKGQSSKLPNIKRYIQWRASLSTTDGVGTPVLLNVTIQYQKPVSKVELSVDGKSTWVLATGRYPWSKTLDLPEDTTNVWVRVTDAAGDTNLTNVTVTVDTTPPTGSVVMDDDAASTGELAVTLQLQASDRYGVAEMMVSDQPDFTGAYWTNFTSTMDWTVAAPDGVKTVYAMFKDVHGNVCPPVNDTIVLDTTAPTGSVLIADGAQYTNATDVALRLSASDASGVTEMALSESPTFEGAPWVAFNATAQFRLQPVDGMRTVHARFRDALGHESQTANDTIVLDTTPPELSLLLNDGAQYTNSPALDLWLTAEDASPIALMQVGEGAAPAWGLIEAFSQARTLTISSGEGERAVAARVWDAAGNMGPTAWATIILDTVPPVVTVALADGAEYTNGRRVNVKLDATDQSPLSLMQLGEDPELKGVEPVGYLPFTTFMLSQRDGLKTVHARAVDAAGNQGPVASDSITLDTTPPAMGITINEGAALTNDPRVTVRLSVDEASGTEYIELDTDASFTSAQRVPFVASMEWTLSPPDGLKSLYVRATDVAGNLGEAATASITLDTTAPVVTITINGGAALTNRTDVTVEVQLIEAHPGGRVEMSDDPSFSTVIQCVPGVPFGRVLPMGDGPKVLYARATDLAGNGGEVATASIALDTTPPSLRIVVEGGSALTSDREVAVALDASDASGVVEMAVVEAAAIGGALAVPFAPSATVTLTGADGTKALAARVRDGAGNWCDDVTATIVLDTAPPTTTLLVAHNDSRALDFLVSWAGVDDTSGVGAYDVQYRIGDGPWLDWQNGTTATQAVFTGEAGKVYHLRARGTDLAGNVGRFPEGPAGLAKVTIEGPEGADGEGGGPSLTVIVAIAVVIGAVLVATYLVTRRGRAKGGG